MSVDSNLEATLLSSPTPSSSSRHAETMDTCSAEPSVPVTTSIPITSSVPVPTLSSPSTTVSPPVVPPPLPVPSLPSTTASVQHIPPPTSFPCPPPISHPSPPLLGSCPSLLGAYSSTVPPPVPTAPPQPIARPPGEGMSKEARTRSNKKKAALLSVTFTSLTSTTTSAPTKPTYAEAAQRPPAPPSQSLPYTERPGLLPTPPPHLLVRQSRSTFSKQTVSSSSSFTSTAPRRADTSYTQFPRRPISSSSASSSSTSFGKSAKRPAATVPESSAGKWVNRSQCRLCPVAHSNLPLHSEQSHLPWFCNPESVCWRCQKVLTTDAEMAVHSMPNHRPSFSGNHTLLWGQLFLGSLHSLASLLSLSSLRHIFTYVHEEHLFPSTPRSIPERLSSSLNYFEEQFLQRPVGALREYRTSPPSRLLSLTHWETIIIILSPEDRERFRTYACPMDLDGRPIETPSSLQPQAPVATLQAPTPIPFIDTHMHLDMSLSRHHLSSLDELEQQFRTGNLELVAVVAN